MEIKFVQKHIPKVKKAIREIPAGAHFSELDWELLSAEGQWEYYAATGHDKIACIKNMRTASLDAHGNVMGLKEAKDLCEMLWAGGHTIIIEYYRVW